MYILCIDPSLPTPESDESLAAVKNYLHRVACGAVSHPGPHQIEFVGHSHDLLKLLTDTLHMVQVGQVDAILFGRSAISSMGQLSSRLIPVLLDALEELGAPVPIYVYRPHLKLWKPVAIHLPSDRPEKQKVSLD